MKITTALIKQITTALENTCFLHCENVEIMESDEWIIHYRHFLTNCTVSIYFFDTVDGDCVNIGYYDKDGKYTLFGYMKHLENRAKETFLFDLCGMLRDLENFFSEIY